MLNTTSTEAVNSLHNTQNIKKEHDLLSESVTYFQDIHVEVLNYYFSNSVAIQKVKQKQIPVVSPSSTQSTLSNGKPSEIRGQEGLVGQLFCFSF
jgi:hypothetical protein